LAKWLHSIPIIWELTVEGFHQPSHNYSWDQMYLHVITEFGWVRRYRGNNGYSKIRTASTPPKSRVKCENFYTSHLAKSFLRCWMYLHTCAKLSSAVALNTEPPWHHGLFSAAAILPWVVGYLCTDDPLAHLCLVLYASAFFTGWPTCATLPGTNSSLNS
jgi:hypothetical protein